MRQIPLRGQILVVLLLSWLLSAKATAQEPHPFFEGARAYGMGGAQIAVVNDETALLANPAALGKLRDTYGTILDPEIDVGYNAYNFYQSQSFSNPLDPAAVVPALPSNKGAYYHARAQLFPSIVLKNFGFGIFAKQELDMQMNAAGTSVNTYYVQDAAVLLGYSMRLFDGKVKIGVTGKAIDRVQINNPSLVYPGNFAISSNASEGAGIGSDVGLILTAPWAWLPTLSGVVRDVGGTAFTAGKNIALTTTGTPTPLQQDYDVALAVFPIHSPKLRSSFTIEARQIIQAQASQDQYRYLHAGYELNVADAVFLRAGMNGHWWTAGIETAGSHIQLQLATYGQDVGQGTTITEDRRYIFKFAFRF